LRKGFFAVVVCAGCVASLVFDSTAANAAFPGGNGKIAFSRHPQGSYNDIFVANPDGTGVQDLTNSDSVDDTGAAWSADGTKIAFWSTPYVATINADGSGYKTFYFGGAPTFSPDGSQIAYGSTARFFPESNQEIFAMRSDGSNLRNVTNDPLGPEYPDDYTPAWSPDGTKIAFTSDRSHPFFAGLFTMNPDGSQKQSVTTGPASEPDWSPDGTRLAFDRFGDIYVINPDGSGEQRLTSSTEDDQHPVWSPDGSKIAFHRLRPGTATYDIYVIDANGGNEQLAIPDGREPDWQPVPNRPPDCSSVVASRSILMNANRRLVPLSLDGASDPDGDAVTVSVDGVTQDEPVTGRGDRTAPDAIDEGDGELRVRAERDPRGDGRVYRIAFTASDGRGGSCSGAATVSVPRKKRRPAVDSTPPSYDSLAP